MASGVYAETLTANNFMLQKGLGLGDFGRGSASGIISARKKK